MARSTIAVPRQLVRDFGTCLRFDGADDEVVFADSNSLDILNAITMSAWIKLESYGESNQGRIIDKDPGTGAYGFMVNNASGVQGLRVVFNLTAYTSNNNILKIGEWQHVAVTWDKDAGSNEIKFYVNGVAAGTASRNTATTATGSSLKIGSNQLGDRAFAGSIDEVKIYNRALTATEIANEYIGANSSTSGLVLYTKFDEGSGSSATDSSGTQSAGTITGATYSTDVFIKPRTAAANRQALNNFEAAGNPITNLVINPSFETNSSNYSTENGASLARITTDGKFGSCCGEVTATTSAFSRIYRNITLTESDKGKRVVLSMYIKAGTSTNAHIEIGFSGSGSAANLAISNLTSEWVRYSTSIIVPSNATGHIIYIYAKTKNTAESGTIFIDGVQFEVIPNATLYPTYPTNYCDGTQANCSWSGTVHASTSSRSTNVARLAA